MPVSRKRYAYGQARHLEADFVVRRRYGPQACAEGAWRCHGRGSGPHCGGTRRRHGTVLGFHEKDPWRAEAREHEGSVRCTGRSSIPMSTSVTGNGVSSWKSWKRFGAPSSSAILRSSYPSSEEVRGRATSSTSSRDCSGLLRSSG